MRMSVTALLGGLVVLAVTVELLRRRQLREKYAVLWLGVSVSGMLVAIFPGLLSVSAKLLGFQVPANLLFAVSALVLLVVAMQLSLEVGRLEDESQRLAEEVALLRHDLDEFRAAHGETDGTGEGEQ